MIEVGDTKIEVDDAKSGAGETAAPRAGTDGDAAPAFVLPADPLLLQPAFQSDDKRHYHVSELLRYHDRHFIENVYQAILRRAPSAAEQARELDELRGGRAGKVEIIERLLALPEARLAGGGVRVEGLPSPLVRRLVGVPVIGYLVRLARALVRLPVLMQHQQQFEIYALAQQQLIADYVNEKFAQVNAATASPSSFNAAAAGEPTSFVPAPSQYNEVVEALTMFSDALLDLSNSHAELQEQTRALQTQTQAAQTQAQASQEQVRALQERLEALREQTQTQVEQAQAALVALTEAITAQQQLAETLRREQELAADAQQEFLIHEQRVIVETQKVVLEELREGLRAELRALSEGQFRARSEPDAEARRQPAPLEEEEAAAANTAPENFSGQA